MEEFQKSHPILFSNSIINLDLMVTLLDVQTASHFNKSQHSIETKTHYMKIRFLSRFFDPVGHETTYASSGKKHFSLNNVNVRPTKIMNKADKNWGKSKFSKASFIKGWSPSPIFFKEKNGNINFQH